MNYTQEQTKANRKKWIEALRSDEYEKTEGKLIDGTRTKYCCLGVACDISGLGKWHETEDARQQVYTINHVDHSSALPQEVQEWLGLTTKYGGYYIKATTPHTVVGRSLAMDNDDGKSFLEIANIIESEIEGLLA